MWEIISGIGQGLGSVLEGVLGPVLDWFGLQSTNETNENIAAQTNLINKMNVDNTNALNEKLQREQWQRDDTSYQRMVADMNKAGLNPLSSFNSPTSSSLSAQMVPAQFNAPHMQAPDWSNLGKGFSDLGNAMIQQEQLDLKQQSLNLEAIIHGVNPKQIQVGSDNDELVDFFKKIFDANLMQLQKDASSPYVKGEGLLGKTAKDVKETVGTIRKIVKDASGNDIKDIPAALKNVKVVDSRDTKQSQKATEEYYYNSSKKNKNSKFRSFKNWASAKLGW